MRYTGYRLLVHEAQDPLELVTQGETLRVRGRGASHQVDVLGEFAFTPAFSMPVRLFVEAKFNQDRCGLDVVRNAHGVLDDVNENFVSDTEARPRRRYRYSYVLFSASGFTAEAQRYALAHQISLVNLSGVSFSWLLGAIGNTAWTLAQAQEFLPESEPFPLIWLRTELRKALGTSPVNLLPAVTVGEGKFKQAAAAAIAKLVSALQQRSDAELLLGFPAAPFILPLAADDHQKFLGYADAKPDHAVRIKRRGGESTAEWTLSPYGAEDAYLLAFELPEHVEKWISDISDNEHLRTLEVKEQYLSSITIYRMNGEGVRAYQLRYEAGSFSRD
jgi:hypothetical protein